MEIICRDEQKSCHDFTRLEVFINILLTTIMAVFLVTPYLVRNGNSYFKFALFILWLLSSLLICKPSKIINKTLVFTVAFVVFQMLYVLIDMSTISLTTIIDRVPFYFVPYCSGIIIDIYSKKEKQFLLFTLFSVFFINLLIMSVYYLNGGTDSGTFTYLSSSWTSNAGSTTFIFCVSFVILLLVIYIIFVKRHILFLLLLVLFSFFFLLFLSTRVTTLILFAIFFVALISILFLFKRKQDFGISVFKLLIIATLLAIVIVNLVNILENVATIIDLPYVDEKINDLILSIKGQSIDSQGSLSQRLEYDGVSIKTFTQNLSSILFGIGEQAVPGHTRTYVYLSGIGGHSEFIDKLAEYGVVGFSVLTLWLFSCFSNHKRIKNSTLRKTYFLLLIMIFAYGWLNRMLEPDGFVIFFLLFPLFYSVVDEHLRNHSKV